MGLSNFFKKQKKPENIIKTTDKIPQTKNKSEHNWFNVSLDKWLKYYKDFIDLKFSLIEEDGEHRGEYDTAVLIYYSLYDKNKSKDENKLIIEKVTLMIFDIYDNYEKPAKEYVKQIKSRFQHSIKNQANLFFLIDQAVDSHIPV
jgi:hypothetical protein